MLIGGVEDGRDIVLPVDPYTLEITQNGAQLSIRVNGGQGFRKGVVFGVLDRLLINPDGKVTTTIQNPCGGGSPNSFVASMTLRRLGSSSLIVEDTFSPGSLPCPAYPRSANQTYILERVNTPLP
jgi:hypothetical protein